MHGNIFITVTDVAAMRHVWPAATAPAATALLLLLLMVLL